MSVRIFLIAILLCYVTSSAEYLENKISHTRGIIFEEIGKSDLSSTIDVALDLSLAGPLGIKLCQWIQLHGANLAKMLSDFPNESKYNLAVHVNQNLERLQERMTYFVNRLKTIATVAPEALMSIIKPDDMDPGSIDPLIGTMLK